MKLYCQLKGCCSKIDILVRALPNPQPRRHVASSATKTDADGTITYSFGGSASTDVNPPSNITQQSIASPASTTTLTPSQPVGEYPHPAFCQAVLAKFPSADGICSVEEARVLYSANYTFLDVRSAEELDSEGKILPKMPRVLHIPIVNFAKRYDATKGRKIVEKTVNGRFVAQVEKIVSTKDQGLILVCSGVPSQGDVRSISALNKLREAGYEKVVALKAGYAVSAA
jgi:rhodanese-related sulfurtransferase